MPLVLLTYSGHYPDKVVCLTPQEIKQLDKLEEEGFLMDSQEGLDFMALLEQKESIPPLHTRTIIMYE